jgi:hypothetical protein
MRKARKIATGFALAMTILLQVIANEVRQSSISAGIAGCRPLDLRRAAI